MHLGVVVRVGYVDLVIGLVPSTVSSFLLSMAMSLNRSASAPRLAAESDSGHVKHQHFLGGEGSFSQLHDCRNLLGAEMMGTVADIESVV